MMGMKCRSPALLALLAVAGCSGSPAALGITGPAPLEQPVAPDDSTIANPGLQGAPSFYGPSIGPSATGNGQFLNYK